MPKYSPHLCRNDKVKNQVHVAFYMYIGIPIGHWVADIGPISVNIDGAFGDFFWPPESFGDDVSYAQLKGRAVHSVTVIGIWMKVKTR